MSTSLKTNKQTKPRTEAISLEGKKEIVQQILQGFSSSLHYPRAAVAVEMDMATW